MISATNKLGVLTSAGVRRIKALSGARIAGAVDALFKKMQRIPRHIDNDESSIDHVVIRVCAGLCLPLLPAERTEDNLDRYMFSSSTGLEADFSLVIIRLYITLVVETCSRWCNRWAIALRFWTCPLGFD